MSLPHGQNEGRITRGRTEDIDGGRGLSEQRFQPFKMAVLGKREIMIFMLSRPSLQKKVGGAAGVKRRDDLPQQLPILQHPPCS